MFKRGRAEGRDFFLGCIAQHKRDFLEGGNIEVFVIGRARLDMADCADKSFAERLHTMISNVENHRTARLFAQVRWIDKLGTADSIRHAIEVSTAVKSI